MDNRFYVYEHIRLDTMKPFYVGKGCGYRAYAKRGRNIYWRRIVDKHGYIVKKIAENLDEDLAFLTEVERIDQLRRLGIDLTNMTDGGEGVSGLPEATLIKRGKCISAALNKPDVKAKKINSLKLAWADPERKAAWSNAVKKSMSTPEYKAKRSAVAKRVNNDPIIKAKLIATRKAIWSSAEKRAKLSETMRAVLSTPEARQKKSEAAKLALSSPEARKKLSLAHLGRVKQKVCCPHCGKIGGIGSMRRWHFDNCKLKEK